MLELAGCLDVDTFLGQSIEDTDQTKDGSLNNDRMARFYGIMDSLAMKLGISCEAISSQATCVSPEQFCDRRGGYARRNFKQKAKHRNVSAQGQWC